jgi:putative Holliday junction resolvase
MNILGIDYGKKRSGLAWVQSGLDVVLPFGQVKAGDAGVQAQKIADVVEQEHIDRIVIGFPLGLDGKENENTKRVRAFAAMLEGLTAVPIELVDERFTTAEANRMGGDVSPDEKAAMLIVQSYLDKQS